MFKKLFVKKTKTLKTEDTSSPERPALPENYADLKEKAFHHTQTLMDVHSGTWGIDKADNYNLDLEKSEIMWTFADGKIASASAQLVCSWTSNDDSLLWGWEHPSAPIGTAIAAKQVKAHADTHNILELQNKKTSCTFDEGWALSSIAILVGNLQGVYRLQASPVAWVYIGFGKITLSKSDN